MRPSTSTKTWVARLITACITCSIIRIVMLRSMSARSVGTMAATSAGLRPASTSSSSRSFGPVASARATSSRLLPAVVRLAAGRSSSSPSPTCPAMSAAASSASARERRDRCAPMAIFSRTVRPVMSAPRWKMRPALGGWKPLMMENSVVLPAPFGPIRAVMWPASMASETSSTASSPPKRLPTRSSRSSGSAMRLLHCRRAPPRHTSARVREQAGNPAWREGHDQNEHAAEDDEVEPRGIADSELGQLAEDAHRQCAEQRAEDGGDAADDGGQQSLDGNPRSVGDAGIDEQEILDVEGAGSRRHGGGNRDGGELDARGIDAERARRIFVFPHRHQPGTEPAVLDQAHDHEREADQRQEDPVERGAALELEGFRPQIEGDQDADAGAGDGCDAGENAQHLGKGQRDKRKIRA